MTSPEKLQIRMNFLFALMNLLTLYRLFDVNIGHDNVLPSPFESPHFVPPFRTMLASRLAYRCRRNLQIV